MGGVWSGLGGGRRNILEEEGGGGFWGRGEGWKKRWEWGLVEVREECMRYCSGASGMREGRMRMGEIPKMGGRL